MKPKKQTAVPPVKAATETETAAALAVIQNVLRDAIENNREQKRFAADEEIYETLVSELAELHAALIWTEKQKGAVK